VYSNDKYVNGETPLVNDIPPSSRATANPLDDDVELTDFVANLRSQLEIFTNRMESDRTRGRSIAVDSSVQTLFMNITSLHSTLMRKTQALEESKSAYQLFNLYYEFTWFSDSWNFRLSREPQTLQYP
jgi:hypothetical protein